MQYAPPGSADALHSFQPQYDNFIGGQWVPPAGGEYFDVISPVNGKVYTKAARGTAADVEKALDAAHAAAGAWGKTSAAARTQAIARWLAADPG